VRVPSLFAIPFTNGLPQANIFIDDDWHVRIADFGLAGWADSTLATSSTGVAGSVRWTAPELYTSEISRRTTASDVYAFACVCLEVSHLHLNLQK